MKTKEHKYLRRLEELYQRIEQWKQIGPACTEEEWAAAEATLEHVDELIRLCSANIDYKVPKYRLKKANAHWKHYSIMNIETVKIAAGTIADIFKNKKQR
jgi:myo-inositol catabolism protein IolC